MRDLFSCVSNLPPGATPAISFGDLAQDLRDHGIPEDQLSKCIYLMIAAGYLEWDGDDWFFATPKLVRMVARPDCN